MKPSISLFLFLVLRPVLAHSQQNAGAYLYQSLRGASSDSAHYSIQDQLVDFYIETKRDSALYFVDRCLTLAQKNGKWLDEASSLSNKGHALMPLKKTQVQLIQKEKLASLGELTAGIAHEVQNPLNFVNNFSEVSAELVDELKEGPFQKLPDPEKEYAEEILGDLTQNLQKITHHGGRASNIVKNMPEHSRTGTGEPQPTDLNALADEYLRIAYHGMRAKDKDGLTVRFNADFITDFNSTAGQVEVMPQEIGRVLLNLYNNAFYAVGERGKRGQADYQPTVTITTRLLPHSPERALSIAHLTGVGTANGSIEIRVSDNGTGIPESIKAKIFQPFFTRIGGPNQAHRGGYGFGSELKLRHHHQRAWRYTHGRKPGRGRHHV